jgi:hypothetical protein
MSAGWVMFLLSSLKYEIIFVDGYVKQTEMMLGKEVVSS